MRRIQIIVSLIILSLTIGVAMSYFRQNTNQLTYKKLVAISIFGKEGRILGEFNHPASLAVKDNYLFVGDGGNNRIQTLKINTDGSLAVQSEFGKEGKGLGEFGIIEALVIRKNYLYISDWAGQCIQILEIKY